MPLSLILRRLLLITILVLPQWFWMGRAYRLAAGWQRHWMRLVARAFLVFAVLAMVLVLCDRIVDKFLPATVSAWIAPTVQLWIFTSTFTFFCLSILKFFAWPSSKLLAVLKRSEKLPAEDLSRRLLLRRTATAATSVPFFAAGFGYLVERLRFEIVRVDVPIANLPQALEGLQIVQLSDIHVGDFMPLNEVRRAVEMANSLSPQLVVITGDFLTSRGDPLEGCIAELSLLRAPLGVWGCNGNHEIYAGAEEQAAEFFQERGMRLLRQSAETLRWRGEDLNLIGIDYAHNVPISGSSAPSLNGIERLVRPEMPNFLLSHNPNTFYRAAAAGIDLSLAGHTHGGQVTIEILHHAWSPARFMTRFVAGLYHLPMPERPEVPAASVRQASLYVTRGLGTLGIPARLGATPEITLLTLQCGEGLRI
jgi:predicted MPP superfamily phosphohydrolase